MRYFLTCFLLGLVCIANASDTDTYKTGDLTIEAPYSRSTPPMAPVGGGFMTIINNGAEADTLVSGSTTFSKAFEIHEMSMKDGIMKMAQLESGLVIPAGETVILKPGSYHLMFIALAEQLKPDERRKVTLIFEKAGEIEVEFVVKDILKMDHSKMDHSKMKMDHSSMEATKAE